MRLKDKVAIVTGSTAGIGKATAQIMAREGANIVVTSRDEEKAKKAASEIESLGGKALAVKLELGNDDDIERMVESTISEFGRVDILVNNAAYLDYVFLPFHQKEIGSWKPEIEVSIGGTLMCCRYVIPHMLSQKSGRIITVCSNSGKKGVPCLSIYSLCKAAMAGWSRVAAAELATEGITVNCVSPGLTGTEDILERVKDDPELKSYPHIPMGRVGKPEEIGSLIAFLASDEASYITGQDYNVDGGMTL